ncbi:MAG: glycoside hydrolase family 97 protein [Bacteroidaceae bacterium]|nr:glycoside hydrolase family 97 protein [Bacteroidaceae bacterium]
MKVIVRNLFIAFTLLSLFPLSASAQAIRVLSPDKLTYLDFKVEGGKPFYSAGYRTVSKKDTLDVQMLEPSPLGLKGTFGDLSSNLKLLNHKVQYTGQPQKYHLRQGKQSEISYDPVMAKFDLVNTQTNVNFTVEFQISNNNIAFRYQIHPYRETLSAVVTEELTGFDMPSGTSAFICPQSDAMIGWKRTKPSYEEYYIWDEPATTKSQYGHGWTFPCLFRKGEGWLLISETGVSGNYCGSHLSDATPDGLFTIAYPMPEENNGFGSAGAQIGLSGGGTSPYDDKSGFTPWRTLTLGPSLKPIVETTIAWDVVEQLYEPSIEYKGSRNTWSWIIWQDASINYNDQKEFIDLAASLGWEGCLIDGGWFKNIGRKRMELLFAYCKEKGVRPWVWYNSNGGWNDAPQCARHCMSNPISRKAEMKWLQKHGVAGIKVDFFAGDKQETMRLYEAILSDANDFGIQVIFHGCTLPRGWERMYPNYCSSEAVLASENLVFGQPFCDLEARHACLHPFVRNTTASMEYGGTVLQKRLNRGNNGGTTRRTSDIFELATAIAFQSSGQNFALTPRDLTEQPQFEIDFMKQVPTTWDETRFIDGYPGKYVVLARRNGSRWYIVAMNAEQEQKKLTIDLAGLFEAKTTLTYLHDGKDGKTPASTTLTTNKKRQVSITLLPQCAAVLLN